VICRRIRQPRCQSKIEDFRWTIRRDDDVRTFEVAMNDSALVRVVQCVSNLAPEAQKIWKFHRAIANQVAEGSS
jgi:hypothetical protein